MKALRFEGICINRQDHLVKEYCREVTKAEWADKPPPKTARWAVFAAAGAAARFLLNPLAGTAVGVAPARVILSC